VGKKVVGPIFLGFLWVNLDFGRNFDIEGESQIFLMGIGVGVGWGKD
jgi:hypothetical protein